MDHPIDIQFLTSVYVLKIIFGPSVVLPYRSFFSQCKQAIVPGHLNSFPGFCSQSALGGGKKRGSGNEGAK